MLQDHGFSFLLYLLLIGRYNFWGLLYLHLNVINIFGSNGDHMLLIDHRNSLSGIRIGCLNFDLFFTCFSFEYSSSFDLSMHKLYFDRILILRNEVIRMFLYFHLIQWCFELQNNLSKILTFLIDFYMSKSTSLHYAYNINNTKIYKFKNKQKKMPFFLLLLISIITTLSVSSILTLPLQTTPY